MNRKITIPVKIKIQNQDFDVSEETKILRENQTGAIVNFVGVVRGFDERNNSLIDSMTLEHYPGMTELEIEKIVKQSYERWNITGVTVIHRVGKLLPSDQIVFVGVSAKHRQNAFDSCSFQLIINKAIKLCARRSSIRIPVSSNSVFYLS